MARNTLSRDYGISLGRLSSYTATYNDDAAQSHGAIMLRREMEELVAKKSVVRVNGRQSSQRTQRLAVEVLGEFCTRLWRLGFHVTALKNINGKHIEAYVRDQWACGCSPKHLSTIMTQLNKLGDWLARPGMVRSKDVYLPEVNPGEFEIQFVAKKSKSWDANGVDVKHKMELAFQTDERFGLMLLMTLAFGLRRCEALQIKPWVDDRGHYLDIRPGIAKGGRPRTIAIDHAAQRHVLDYVKSQIGRLEHLGWKRGAAVDSLQRNEKRYSAMLAKIGITKREAGVTGHGLRAQYAEDMALLRGLVPATLGGDSRQLPTSQIEGIRLQISENLGHSRMSVTGAYFGEFAKNAPTGNLTCTVQITDTITALLFVSPEPVALADGTYPKRTIKEVRGTTISVSVVARIQGDISKTLGTLDFKQLLSKATLDGRFVLGKDLGEGGSALFVEKVKAALVHFGINF
jgi:integrase